MATVRINKNQIIWRVRVCGSCDQIAPRTTKTGCLACGNSVAWKSRKKTLRTRQAAEKARTDLEAELTYQEIKEQAGVIIEPVRQTAPIPISDDDLRAIQTEHYQRTGGSRLTNQSVQDALTALISLWRVKLGKRLPLSTVGADDLPLLESAALALPREASTVNKWFDQLKAALSRCMSINGIVPTNRLLQSNPFDQYPKKLWCKARPKTKRVFTEPQLLSLLESVAPVARLALQSFFWSGCRRTEIASMVWSNLRVIDGEAHWYIRGKHAIERWWRMPAGLLAELESLRTESDWVFAAYSTKPFAVSTFGRWIYRAVKRWSASKSDGGDYLHATRATALNAIRRGKRSDRTVAADACVTSQVADRHYLIDGDDDMRAASNRVFDAIGLAVSAELAAAFGRKGEAPLVIGASQEDWDTDS